MGVKLVSPRMLLEFARAPEDVLIIYELGLVGVYAGLSKLFHRRKVISLVEGDYRHIGRAGTAPLKVVVRRLAARSVDVFVANNPPAASAVLTLARRRAAYRRCPSVAPGMDGYTRSPSRCCPAGLH